MEPLNEALVERIDRYIERLFVAPDPTLEQNLRESEAAGLPNINVSATEGKLLYLVARIARAARILEVGTLGGYSTTWLARALPPGGQLVETARVVRVSGQDFPALSSVHCPPRIGLPTRPL